MDNIVPNDTISLHHHIDENLDELRLYYDSKFSDLERSTQSIALNLDRRLDTMNEFRGAIQDQASNFVTRAEYMLNHDRMVDDIRNLRESRALLEGKASQNSANFAIFLSICGVLVAIFALIVDFFRS